jgi:hypothetical protein
MDEEPVFSITYPVGWTVFTERDTDLLERPPGVPPMPLLVSARPQTGLLWFGTWVVRDVATFDEAEDYLTSLVGHLFDNEETTYVEEGTHYGMTFRYFQGTAIKITTGPQIKKDEKVDYFVAFFKPSEETMGIAIYVGLPNATEKYGEELQASLSSIRPARSLR